MTTTESTSTTEERIVVLPEITIPIGSRASAAAIFERAEALMPELEELHAMAIQLRDLNDEILVKLYPVMGCGTEEVHDLAGRASGWVAVWERLVDIGDLFDASVGLQLQGLTLAEIERGGERSFPGGTLADIKDPEGLPIRVMVQRVPLDGDQYSVVNMGDIDKYYLCDHAELKAGIVAEEVDELKAKA